MGITQRIADKLAENKLGHIALDSQRASDEPAIGSFLHGGAALELVFET